MQRVHSTWPEVFRLGWDAAHRSRDVNASGQAVYVTPEVFRSREQALEGALVGALGGLDVEPFEEPIRLRGHPSSGV